MGDVWVQLAARVDADAMTLATDVATKMRAEDLEAYTALLQREPANPSRHDAVALLYLQGERADRAVTHVRESVRLDPAVAATHSNLGLALAAARHYPEALAVFRQAVALDGQHAEAENNLGALLHATGRVDEAEPHYRRALALRPEHAEAHDNLSRILSTRGQRAEAVTHFRAALDLRPDWARPMIGLTWLWRTSRGSSEGDVAEAIRLGERAVGQTGRSDALALDALAAAYAAAGQFDRATARAAIDVAIRGQLSAFADEFRTRLALYEGRRPFRQE
jgi:Flp pilus assembly protein TadD